MTVRKTITVTANEEEFLVKELTPREIMAFIDGGGKTPPGAEEDDVKKTDAEMVKGLFGQVDELLEISIPGLKVDTLYDWAPSEIEKIYIGFKEVNSVFFGIAQRLGVDRLLGEIEQAIARDFSKLFASSLKRATPMP